MHAIINVQCGTHTFMDWLLNLSEPKRNLGGKKGHRQRKTSRETVYNTYYTGETLFYGCMCMTKATNVICSLLGLVYAMHSFKNGHKCISDIHTDFNLFVSST